MILERSSRWILCSPLAPDPKRNNWRSSTILYGYTADYCAFSIPNLAVKHVIGRMISTKKVVRYRDFYGKNKKKFD